MKKRYPFYFIAILILVLSFGVMVKRAISDVAINSMRSEFIQTLRTADLEKTMSYIDSEHSALIYESLKRLSKSELVKLANIFEEGKLVEQTPTKRTYRINGMIDGIAVDVEFAINLDQNGQWKFSTDSSPYHL